MNALQRPHTISAFAFVIINLFSWKFFFFLIKVLASFILERNDADGSQSRKLTQTTPTMESGSIGPLNQRAMDPSQMLRKLLSESENK